MKNFEKLNSFLLPGLGLIAIAISFLALGILLFQSASQGMEYLSWRFLVEFPSRIPAEAGIFSSLIGSFYLLILTAIIAIPLGIFTAVFIEEYLPEARFTAFLRLNIANLAAIPSVVYGMLGLAFFVRFLGMERGLLVTAITLSLLIVPVIILASIEAIRAIPKSLREAAYGVGATKAQVTFLQVLPQAMPGILTGIILALSRAAGETAPILVIGGLVFARFLPESLNDQFTTLSVQIFNWSSRPQEEFHALAASAILVLLGLTLGLNLLAIILRAKLMRKKSLLV
ncbi:MAG: phosphate ABC transporter permease PstA [Bdellovibrionota bacterium]